jgi:hypothetical protein
MKSTAVILALLMSGCYRAPFRIHQWRSVHISERDDLGHELPTFGSIEYLNLGNNYVKVMFRLDRVNYVVLTSGDAECANSFTRRSE